ncbi:MAG TPA: peptidoglycan DD-metalloendopeptidase family protein [Dictyoglomaceae bacterium]|nr:peptidoglycan DD-metalloendopeptidase family protein [Dictyoglomaceae bacterium]HOL39747.1 peptidoglycan DD-metalloendopeptidase family protein [Dictyoglomaceae bacterium]
MAKKRKWWKRKFFTLVIVPHDASTTKARRIHISAVFIIVLAIIGLVSTSVILYRVASNKFNEVKHLEVLEQVTEKQKAQLREIETLRKKLKELEETEKRLKDTLGIKGMIPLPKDTKPVYLGMDSFPDQSTFDFQRKIVEVKTLIGEKEKTVAQIEKEVERRKSLLAVTPSRWPTLGFISSGFGWRFHPIFKKKAFHSGVDIVAIWGSPVYATADGFVAYVGWESGYGKVVKINHGRGIVTYYAHLSSYSVKTGQYVKKGQLIGHVGSTGTSIGPHLHYEVRRNGSPVNPNAYLSVDLIKVGKLY